MTRQLPIMQNRKKRLVFSSIDELKYFFEKLILTSDKKYWCKKFHSLKYDEIYTEFTESGITAYAWEIGFMCEFEKKSEMYYDRIIELEKSFNNNSMFYEYTKLMFEEIIRRIKSKSLKSNKSINKVTFNCSSLNLYYKFNFSEVWNQTWGGQSEWGWGLIICPVLRSRFYLLKVKSLEKLMKDGLIRFEILSDSIEVVLVDNLVKVS
jgi:hypothetical protein